MLAASLSGLASPVSLRESCVLPSCGASIGLYPMLFLPGFGVVLQMQHPERLTVAIGTSWHAATRGFQS